MKHLFYHPTITKYNTLLRLFHLSIAITTVCIFIAGCSSYSPAAGDGQTQPADAHVATTPEVNTEYLASVVDPFTEEISGTNHSFEMVSVPGATYLKGNEYQVEVSPFRISSHEITWNLYNLFVEENIEDIRRDLWKVLYGVDIEFDADALASATLTDEVLELLRDADIPADVISKPSPAYGDLSGGMGTDGFPAINMTHYAAHMFTKWLTVKTGNFYRLPTEAEWELACRAGQLGQYAPPANPDNYAWHRGNSDRSYHRVGSKEPNALGIYDMLGNTAEYTLDQFYEDYFERLENEPAADPWFKPTELYPRSVRGGSWMDEAEYSSCLQRRGSNPNWKRNDPQLPKSLWWHTNAYFVGFRVVMPADQPETVEEMEEYWLEAIQDYF